MSELGRTSSRSRRRDKKGRRDTVADEGRARILLDPTSERALAIRPRVPRLESLAGRTLGLHDISKPRGDVFLDRVAELLRSRGAEIARFTKPTFTKPAPVDLRHEIAARCHAVIEALAD
jgi:hypothetical protein